MYVIYCTCPCDLSNRHQYHGPSKYPTEMWGHTISYRWYLLTWNLRWNTNGAITIVVITNTFLQYHINLQCLALLHVLLQDLKHAWVVWLMPELYNPRPHWPTRTAQLAALHVHTAHINGRSEVLPCHRVLEDTFAAETLPTIAITYNILPAT